MNTTENSNSVSKENLHTQKTDVEALAEKEYPNRVTFNSDSAFANRYVKRERLAYIKGYTAALSKNEGWVSNLKDIQTRLMHLIAYNQVPDAACPELNEMIDELSQIIMPLPEASI